MQIWSWSMLAHIIAVGKGLRAHQYSPTEAGSHLVRGGTPGSDSSMPLNVPVAPQKWLGE
jgi:hypothetical protein